MNSIKIGRITHEIKPGDYILYNESCFQFCSGDNRVLVRKGYETRRSLVIPKTVMKKIPWETLRRKVVQPTPERMKLTYWYF